MILTLCLAVVAALFASVGQAGAPGYVAVMGMFGYGPAAIKATAPPIEWPAMTGGGAPPHSDGAAVRKSRT